MSQLQARIMGPDDAAAVFRKLSDSLPIDGLPIDGLPIDGLPIDGLPIDGLPIDGLPIDGLPIDGLPIDGLPIDGLMVLGLDHDRRLAGVALNPRHRALAWVKVWELVDLAAELDACSLVIGQFPRGRPRVPSDYEARAFVDLAERVGRAHVLLLDCVVVRGHQWWSLRERSGNSSKFLLSGLTGAR